MRSRAARTRTSEIYLPHVRSYAYERSITPSNFARTRTSTIRSQALCARTRTSEVLSPLMLHARVRAQYGRKHYAHARVRAKYFPPTSARARTRTSYGLPPSHVCERSASAHICARTRTSAMLLPMPNARTRAQYKCF